MSLLIEHRGRAGQRGRLDPTVWRYDLGSRPGELQSYTDGGANAWVDGDTGQLVLEARRQRTIGRYDGGQVRDYSSARIDTKGKLKILPGSKVEFDALVPNKPGCWPAPGWLVGSSAFVGGAQWPDCGEIDTLEVLGGWRPNTALLNIHAGYYPAKLQAMADAQKTTVADLKARAVHHQVGWSAKTWRDLDMSVWHRYGIEFDDNGVRHWIDGACVLTTPKDAFTAAGAAWPFNKPMDLIFNVAVGGDSGTPVLEEDGSWSAQMRVGPIRITQPNER